MSHAHFRSPRHKRLEPIELGVIAFAVLVVAVILAPMGAGALSAPVEMPAVSGPAKPDPVRTSATLSGRADVRDGDGLRLAGETIRLQGVDAFELYQTCGSGPCGRQAKAALERLTAGRTVECEPVDRDRYGRVVAFCHADGVDLGAELVRGGHALAYTRYSRAYVGQEAEARASRAGAWAGSFQNPADWRRDNPR